MESTRATGYGSTRWVYSWKCLTVHYPNELRSGGCSILSWNIEGATRRVCRAEAKTALFYCWRPFMMSRRLFKDVVTKSQSSDMLGTKWFGSFMITELVARNAIRLDSPSTMKFHLVVHVCHTKPHKSQPVSVSQAISTWPEPIPYTAGEIQFEVHRILGHRKRWKRYQWRTLLKVAPQHEAECHPTRDFVDRDGTVTEAFL